MIASTQGRGFGLGEYLFHQASWVSLDLTGQGAGEMVASQRAQPAAQGSGLAPSGEEEEEELQEFEKFKRRLPLGTATSRVGASKKDELAAFLQSGAWKD